MSQSCACGHLYFPRETVSIVIAIVWLCYFVSVFINAENVLQIW